MCGAITDRIIMIEISGFTFVRNGFTYGYPFLASIRSLLPIVDELVVVVGDSTDGTREAIEELGDHKIKIIDSIWDEESRTNGKIFAQQTNIGIAHTKGNWCFHLQVDEVLHESAKETILAYIQTANGLDEIDGLIFPFYHFWGDYDHIRNTRKTHRFEIRAFKNNRNVFSYHDSQGFRKYTSFNTYEANEKGAKLNVLNTGVPVYHYSYARNPRLMQKKFIYFNRFYHDDSWIKRHINRITFDYRDVDKLELFKGEHPVYMKEIINRKDWDFIHDISKSNMSLRYRFLYEFEKLTNYRLFEYKNYKLKKLRAKNLS